MKREPVLAVVCVRHTSGRFPGKSMAELAGKPILEHIIERLSRADSVGRIVVAAANDGHDAPVLDLCRRLGINALSGSTSDVLARFGEAVRIYGQGFKYVFRAMADQPFLDWYALDESTALLEDRGWDLALPWAFDRDPVYGAGLCPWRTKAFWRMFEASKGDEREHPGLWFRRHLDGLNYGLRDLPHWAYRPYRLELDTAADLMMFRAVWKLWDRPQQISLIRAITAIDTHPEVSKMNAHVGEKSGPFTTVREPERDVWRRDYERRDVVWSVSKKGGVLRAPTWQRASGSAWA